MSTRRDDVADKFDGDDLSRFIAEQEAADPEFAAARRDIGDRHALLDALVHLRQAQGLSQAELADRLGISQQRVSAFEAESSEPRLSTVQRYARAVGVTVSFRIEDIDRG